MKKRNVRLAAAAAAVLLAAGSLALPAFAAQSDNIAGQVNGAPSSARSVRERDSQTMNSVYLLPDSDTYYISEADVSWMDDTELMLARNEFYARRGRKFVTKSIQDYFNRQAWYEGTIEPDAFTPEMFNRYEQANVDFIVAYEAGRKEARRKREEEAAPRDAISSSNPTADNNEDKYGEIVEIYRNAICEEWSTEDIATAGMNGMVGELGLPEELGYTYRDLDGDGSGELLIGPTDSQVYGEGAVFEIYTVEDGIAVEVASSAVGDMYYVCEDNTIRRELVQDDGHWEIEYCELKEDELVCKEVLVMDESMDKEEPWFILEEPVEMEAEETAEAAEAEENIAVAGAVDEGYEAISYEEASEIRANYVAGDLGLIPFE